MTLPEVEDLTTEGRRKLYWLGSGLTVVALASVTAIVWMMFVLISDPDEEPPSRLEPSPMQSETTKTLSAEEKLFVSSMRERSSFATESDIKLLESGEAVCTAFDTGASWNVVTLVITDSGVDPYDAGWLMAGSVVHLCPQNRQLLPEGTRD